MRGNQAIIRPMGIKDAPDVLSIHKQCVEAGETTFASPDSNWSTWNEGHISLCRLIAQINGQVIRWAALSAMSSRCVYQGVSEVSIYISPNHQKIGLGNRLLRELIQSSEQHNIWTLTANIFSFNQAGIKLFQKHGFKHLGQREKLGKKTYAEI